LDSADGACDAEDSALSEELLAEFEVVAFFEFATPWSCAAYLAFAAPVFVTGLTPERPVDTASLPIDPIAPAGGGPGVTLPSMEAERSPCANALELKVAMGSDNATANALATKALFIAIFSFGLSVRTNRSLNIRAAYRMAISVTFALAATQMLRPFNFRRSEDPGHSSNERQRVGR
jgi:hypothetical protein